MNKVAAIVFAGILAIIVAAWLIMYYAPRQTDVNVTQFAWTSSWGPGPVGTLWGRSFNVTLHNPGENVTGLTLQIRLSDNSSELWSQTWLHYQDESSPNVNFSLYAGEIHEFQGGFMTKLDELENAQGEETFTVLVKLGDAVLDELPVT